MSGLEIAGLVAGIIGLIGPIRHAYNEIKDLRGLPTAFHDVVGRLSVVEKTLQAVEGPAQEEEKVLGMGGQSVETLEKLLQDCKRKIEELKEIFATIRDSKDKSVIATYRMLIVRIGKKGRVESLMGDILKDVTTLTGYRVFQTATQQQVEELKKAIEYMAQVEPSLSDSEFEEKATSITHHGQGAINNASQYGTGTQKNIFGTETQVAGHYIAGNIAGNVSFVDKWHRGQTDDDPYLGDLWLTDPRYDKKRIEELKGGLLRDSYSWILENEAYKRWALEDTSLLWIKGDPGKGKTMLVCGIIDTLHPFTKLASKDYDTFLSYFFIEASEERNNTAISVLRGLICLLADQDRSLASKLLQKHKECGKTLFEGPNAWFALCEVFTDFMEDIQSPTCLIIDALDECKVGLGDLLDFISSQPALPDVKWIVSSRNWPEIEEYLNFVPTNARLSLELNETAVSGAVNTYIQHRVEELVTPKGYDDTMKQAVQDYLTENAHNTFLWVSLVCKMLRRTPRWATLKQLETFPPGLIALYERMAQKVQNGEDGNEDYSTLYRKIIATVMTVLRPISLDELRSLEEFPDGGSDDLSLIEIVGLCGSFLTLRARTIYFVHESAKEFLAKSPAGLPYHESEQHHRLFLHSLNAMSRHLRRDILGRESTEEPTSEEDPLVPLRYPCTFWALHLSNSEPDMANQDLVDGSPLDAFLREHFLHWLEALGYMENLSAGVFAMNRLKTLLRSQTSQFTKLVRDGSRFVQYHGPGIEMMPLQAYISALLFSPSCSIMGRIYRESRPEWIAPKPVKDGNWSACLRTIESHTDNVSSIAFSHDGRRLVSASWDKTVRVWDTETWGCLRILTGHARGVVSVAFSPDGRWIASGSADHTIRIWDRERGTCMRTLLGHTGRVNSVAFNPDTGSIVSGSTDKTIKHWNSETGICMLTEDQHHKAVSSIAFSNDGRYLASASSTLLMVRDNQTEEHWDFGCDPPTFFDDSGIHIAAFSPSNRLAVSIGYQLYFWDPAERERRRRFGRRGRPANAVAFSPHGRLFASSCDVIGLIEIFNARTAQLVIELQERASSIAFSSTGINSCFATAIESKIKIWDLRLMKKMAETSDRPLVGNEQYCIEALFSPDGSLVASLSSSRSVDLWNATTGNHGVSFKPSSWVSPVFSPDGSFVLQLEPSIIIAKDTCTGATKWKIKTEFNIDSVTKPVISYDSRLLVLAVGSRVEVWDLETRECIRRLACDGAGVLSSVFSHDNRFLAAGTKDFIMVWDLTTWDSARWDSTPSPIGNSDLAFGTHAMVFSPDGQFLTTSCFIDKTTYIDTYYVEEGVRKVMFSMEGCSFVRSVDPESSQLETTKGTFKLKYDLESERLDLCRLGYGISEDLQWVIWGAEDGRIERVIWLPPEFRPRQGAPWAGYAYAIYGSKVAIGCESGRVIILGFPPEVPNPYTKATEG